MNAVVWDTSGEDKSNIVNQMKSQNDPDDVIMVFSNQTENF